MIATRCEVEGCLAPLAARLEWGPNRPETGWCAEHLQLGMERNPGAAVFHLAGSLGPTPPHLGHVLDRPAKLPRVRIRSTRNPEPDNELQ